MDVPVGWHDGAFGDFGFGTQSEDLGGEGPLVTGNDFGLVVRVATSGEYRVARVHRHWAVRMAGDTAAERVAGGSRPIRNELDADTAGDGLTVVGGDGNVQHHAVIAW